MQLEETLCGSTLLRVLAEGQQGALRVLRGGASPLTAAFRGFVTSCGKMENSHHTLCSLLTGFSVQTWCCITGWRAVIPSFLKQWRNLHCSFRQKVWQKEKMFLHWQEWKVGCCFVSSGWEVLEGNLWFVLVAWEAQLYLTLHVNTRGDSFSHTSTDLSNSLFHWA